jgi:hypothetical protein
MTLFVMRAVVALSVVNSLTRGLGVGCYTGQGDQQCTWVSLTTLSQIATTFTLHWPLTSTFNFCLNILMQSRHFFVHKNKHLLLFSRLISSTRSSISFVLCPSLTIKLTGRISRHNKFISSCSIQFNSI